MKQSITDLLAHGIENARTARETSNVLNMSARKVTRRIEYERRNEHAPIIATVCGKVKGYYLAETPEEIDEYCESLKHRENEIRKTRRALERTAKEWRG